MYRDGKGVEANPEKAIQLYEEMARTGNTGAISSIIGMCTSKIIQDPILLETAITMMKNLSDGGSGDASNRLGNMYFDGVGVKRDLTEAAKWYERAAALGNGSAKMRLAEMYRDGKGVEANPEKAAYWYSR